MYWLGYVQTWLEIQLNSSDKLGRTYVPKSIPLSSALCVQTIQVVISNVVSQSFNFMLEALACERGDFRMV